ncbi:hypothetical protein KUCAC02_002568 [Chaenocephalus aceratus]|uniref:Uncharacterized protein n=1 Tax=Chaenocephalus aceratus TaxID=36190 RepID=A0ACB9XVX7_CHAAC|nr:hypothetical protein KUCAC02_002568 [Chaenocephalus aceratus]
MHLGMFHADADIRCAVTLNGFQEQQAGAGRGWLSRPRARWSGVATGLQGREEEGMAAGREGSLRVRDEQDIAGDWESGARRGQEEQGPARKDLSLWGREWLMSWY